MSTPSANHSFRLPRSFDVPRLRADLEHCIAADWTRHFNAADFQGDWNGIALRSVSGRTGDILAPDLASHADTPLLATCAYFAEVLATFACPLDGVRLLRLAPGSRIREHRDRGLGYQHGVFRVHIPIVTSGAVSFRVDGVDLPMQPGECWYADFDRPHSVTNDSADPRVHLVIDGRRNDWTDRLFAVCGYDFDAEARSRQPDPDTRRLMIAQLEQMDTDTARALVVRLRADAADA